MQNTTEGLKARFYSGDNPCHVFVVTTEGNFIWEDPHFCGDGEFHSTGMTYRQSDDMQSKVVDFLCEHSIKILSDNTFIWL